MSKYTKYLFLLSVIVFLVSGKLSAQLTKGQLIDGIAAVIGDEIILDSIRENFPELFENNYIYSLPTHTLHFSLLQKLLYRKKISIQLMKVKIML